MPNPPARSTEPSGNSVAVGAARPNFSGAAAAQVPSAGSNSSVSVIITELLVPAMQRTLPVGSRIDLPRNRATLDTPVGVHEPAVGSNVSVEARPAPELSCPPTTSTEPLASIVAVWFQRLVFSALVFAQVPAFMSYISAPKSPLPPRNPPATRTLPLGNNVAE